MKRSTKLILLSLLAVGIWLFLRLVFSGQLVLRRYLFKIGSFEIRFYSLFILTGLIVAYTMARKRCVQEGIKPEQLDELLMYSVVAGILGARLYYVLFNIQYYLRYPLEIFMIWRGGLAIHGAILAGISTFVMYSLLKKSASFTPFQILDLGSAYLPLGQAFGRWGNFFNYEAFGPPTDLPWKMYVPMEYRPFEFRSNDFFHPAFLYEFLWDLFLFFLLTNYMKRHRKSTGEIFALYLVFYSLGRIWIERFRLDSLMFSDFRAAQILSAVFIVVGIFLFYFRRRRGQKLHDIRRG